MNVKDYIADLLKAVWYLPPAVFLGMGIYYSVTEGLSYIVDLRVVFGHGYDFWAYTMVLWGVFGVLMVRRSGRRGLFLAVIAGLTCDIAQTFFGAYLDATRADVFTLNHGLEPVFWLVTIIVCWRLSRPIKLTLVSWWTIGMLITWIAAAHLDLYFGGNSFAGSSGATTLSRAVGLAEPFQMLSWAVASYKVAVPVPGQEEEKPG